MIKEKIRREILLDKFEDSKKGMNALILGHLILLLCFLMGNIGAIGTNSYAQVCLVVIIFYTFIKLTYSWMSKAINVVLVLMYLGLFIFEWANFGMPGQLMEYEQEYQISKGVMLDMFVSLLPSIYTGLRFALIIPLIIILYKSNLINPKWMVKE